MRVEPRQHALHGVIEEFLVGNRFDVIGLDAAEHLGEGAQLIERQWRGCRRGFVALGQNTHVEDDGGADEHPEEQDQNVACCKFH